MKTMIAAAAMLTALSASAFAEPDAETKATVKQCVILTRVGIPQRAIDFDAYATDSETPGNITVHFYGTAKARFDFKKCMAERGEPVGPSSE